MTVAEILELHASSRPLAEIAREVGVDPSTLRKWFRAWGLPPRVGKGRVVRSTGVDPRLGPIYRYLYWDKGMSTREIGVLSGVSHRAVIHRMRVLGVGQYGTA